MTHKSQWKPIHGEIKRKVLVTNNLKEMDAFGNMSHVWLAEYVHSGPYQGLDGKIEDRGEYWTLDGPFFLTHYCEIPQHHSPVICKAQAADQERIRKAAGSKKS